MDSPIIRGSEVEIKLRAARNAAYMAGMKARGERHAAYIEWARTEAAKIDARNASYESNEDDGEDTYDQHCATEGNMRRFI